MKKPRDKAIADNTLRHLESSFFRSADRTFSGYVVDLDEPSRQFTIDILIDGVPLRTTIADEPVYELEARGIGNGCYGFSIVLNTEVLESSRVVEARLSNLARGIGRPVVLDEPYDASKGVGSTGLVRWLGGLRFSGWIDRPTSSAPTIEIHVDGQLVSRAKALGWTHTTDDNENGRAVRSFDIQVPERFADGKVHRLSVIDQGGKLVDERIHVFVAFEDGLAKAICSLGQLESERLRGELFDRLLPMSLPLSSYDAWRERFAIPPPKPTHRKIAVVLVGSERIEGSLVSLDGQTHSDWTAASLTVDGQVASFDPNEALAFLADEAQDTDFIIFARAGTVFEPNALARIVNAFEQYADAMLVYGDFDIVTPDGQRLPLAFTAFDYERMLEQGYCAHLFAMRRSAAQHALTSGPSNLYRLFNCLFDQDRTVADQVVHIPGAIATIAKISRSREAEALLAATSQHLNARGVPAQVTIANGAIFPAIRVARNLTPGSVTIIIPTRNRLSLLRRCLDSIAPAVERLSAQILVVDNDSNDPDTLEYLRSIESRGGHIKVMRIEGPFNFSRLNNAAVASITSEYICLLNNDIEAADDRWLEEMLGRISEPNVGAVGALLLWPSGVIQHGGVVLGSNFAAQHMFNDRVDGDPGFTDLLCVAHECSCVTAACLLTRRSDYVAVDGLDEARFSVAFNDVDYCLKLRAQGKRVVFSPHAKLWHLESASRGNDREPDKKFRLEQELNALRTKWTGVLAEDPYYSPILSLDPIPYSALAWPLRSTNARLSVSPGANQIL